MINIQLLRKKRFNPTLILVTCSLIISNYTQAFSWNDVPKVKPVSPEESLKTMKLLDGYQMSIVAAEPLIEEPVVFTFDGNGRIYVAEMLTYMQNADGVDQLKATSRIKQLQDKDGDGIYESYTVFADQLLLPRMILTLDDGRILVRETNTFDLLLFTDTDGDGIADKKETVYNGGPRGGNLEHQPSGLIYGLDNWAYVTYTNKRYKFKNGKVITDATAYGGGQWGLAQDHIGRMYYSTAGGQDPAFNFQVPSVYGSVQVEGEKAAGYKEVFPIDTTPDVQGGSKMLRDDNTLTHFTGVSGQSIYLGGTLPDLQGDYFVPEPVGNLVRRSHAIRKNGVTTLSHPYQSQQQEFIASSDPNFRPVWSGHAPDGSLMILDMYRGIIQEGNWTKKGSYLRGVIEEYGFDKIIGRGRLYRVTKKGATLTKNPKMFAQTPKELVKHLSHSNGWWRLEAQKLIVLANDKSVIPSLKTLAINSLNPIAQIHALWTLEGLGIVDKDIITSLVYSKHSDVRVTAVRLSEQLYAKGDMSIPTLWENLAIQADIEVSQQIILSGYYVNSPNRKLLLALAKKTHGATKGITAIETAMKNLESLNDKRKKLASGNAELGKSLLAGEQAFNGLCSTCHGKDGKGTKSAGGIIAPSLNNNPRINGNNAQLINILLHGQQGEIDGINYTGGMMPSVASNGNQYIADVLTYIRNSFNNITGIITADEVAKVKALSKGRKSLWTQQTLNEQFNTELVDKSTWKISSNIKENKQSNFLLERVIDGNNRRKYRGGEPRSNQQYIVIELPKVASISEVIIDSNSQDDYFIRGYAIQFSLDGKQWFTATENLQSSKMEKAQTLGLSTKFIKLTNKSSFRKRPLGIDELSLFGRYLP